MRKRITIIAIRAEDLMTDDVGLLPSGGRTMVWCRVISIEPKEEYVSVKWKPLIGDIKEKQFTRFEPVKIQLLKEI